MRILLIFTLLSLITGVVNFTVTGYSGGTVIIYCHYDIDERSKDKYFCMGQNSSFCEDKIRTGVKNTWYHSGRLSLFDDIEEYYFKVVIRKLSRQDEGTYQCAVDVPLSKEPYIEVKLDVKGPLTCSESVTETVYHLGGEATIFCNYPEELENNTKYFCKESNDSKTCYYIISGDRYRKAKSRKLSLMENRTERRYTVTISNLTEYDTGTYWCGVKNSYITLFTKVQLAVTAQPSNLSSLINGPGTSVVILVCVYVVGLLLLISLLIVYRRRHNQTTGSCSTGGQTVMEKRAVSVLKSVVFSAKKVNTDTGVNKECCQGDEVKEGPLQSDTGRANSNVYTINIIARDNADLPDNASIYSNMHPEAATVVSTDGICPNQVTTVQPPEGSHSCYNATVNVGQSICPIKATVNKKECGPEEPTISKEGICPKEVTTATSKEGNPSRIYATASVVQHSPDPTVNHPHSSSEAPPIYSTVNKHRYT
ncbi:hypothetical protein UPYG_G00059080 [Umbra pygmaea]|uniref:Ig-like domain-containing protein n=1 Tax=Umbra pygmaea TaxID=75934 RepID=A0ABD0X8Y2_UMBPY